MKKHIYPTSMILALIHLWRYPKEHSYEFDNKQNTKFNIKLDYLEQDNALDNKVSYLFIINRLKKECIRKHFNDILLFP